MVLTDIEMATDDTADNTGVQRSEHRDPSVPASKGDSITDARDIKDVPTSEEDHSPVPTGINMKMISTTDATSFLLLVPNELLLKIADNFGMSDLRSFRLTNRRCNAIGLLAIDNLSKYGLLERDTITVVLDNGKSYSNFLTMSRSPLAKHCTSLRVDLDHPIRIKGATGRHKLQLQPSSKVFEAFPCLRFVCLQRPCTQQWTQQYAWKPRKKGDCLCGPCVSEWMARSLLDDGAVDQDHIEWSVWLKKLRANLCRSVR